MVKYSYLLKDATWFNEKIISSLVHVQIKLRFIFERIPSTVWSSVIFDHAKPTELRVPKDCLIGNIRFSNLVPGNSRRESIKNWKTVENYGAPISILGVIHKIRNFACERHLSQDRNHAYKTFWSDSYIIRIKIYIRMKMSYSNDFELFERNCMARIVF